MLCFTHCGLCFMYAEGRKGAATKYYIPCGDYTYVPGSVYVEGREHTNIMVVVMVVGGGGGGGGMLCGKCVMFTPIVTCIRADIWLN